MPFRRILIANRGEIAVRVIRACRELGISPVAIYSEADARALHVRLADAAVCVGPPAAAQSYLRGEAIIAAARELGAEAIHPGYGFLSENAAFARSCGEAGLVFIGPPPAAIDAMGGKIGARRLAVEAGVPVVPGYDGAEQAEERLLAEALRIGFPLLVKASAGGGGKGMRAVHGPSAFADALAGARREARAAFGDETVFLERLIFRPRHVEIQILADAHGKVLHLGERECSIQRRHQKILEEAPSPALTPELRAQMGAAAVRVARAAGYVNAGTVEFVLDQSGQFYFLEMNTRLQVEHPVTELVTGLDLVRWQIAIAAGQRLPFEQEALHPRGHAIEARLYAEDPVTYLPAVGRLALLDPPLGPGVRVDAGLTTGDEVTVHYDPMLAKLIVSGESRAAAVERLRRALDDFAVLGLTTNLPLLRALAAHPAYAAGDTHTGFLDEHHLDTAAPKAPPDEALAAAALYEQEAGGRRLEAGGWRPEAGGRRLEAGDPFLARWRANGDRGQGAGARGQEPGGRSQGAGARGQEGDPFVARWRANGGTLPIRLCYGGKEHVVLSSTESQGWLLHIEGRPRRAEIIASSPGEFVLRLDHQLVRCRVARGDAGALLVSWHGQVFSLTPPTPLSADTAARASGVHDDASLTAPMPGTLVKVLVSEGQTVREGQALLILEAMKMEHTVIAPFAGIVRRLPYAQGSSVAGGASLVDLAPEDA